MYGSSLQRVMSSPRFSSKAAMDADARPLPRELTTPPVTKMNLVFLERMGNPQCRRSPFAVNETFGQSCWSAEPTPTTADSDGANGQPLLNRLGLAALAPSGPPRPALSPPACPHRCFARRSGCSGYEPRAPRLGAVPETLPAPAGSPAA